MYEKIFMWRSFLLILGIDTFGFFVSFHNIMTYIYIYKLLILAQLIIQYISWHCIQEFQEFHNYRRKGQSLTYCVHYFNWQNN